MAEIVDVDLLAYETGSVDARLGVVDGTMRSLTAGGFVYTASDLSETLLDDAYDVLERFFALEPHRKQRYVAADAHGARGYTGLGVETAAISDVADHKEMLNWGEQVPAGHPLAADYPRHYAPQVFPTDDIPQAARVLSEFHERLVNLQTRFLRIIAEGIGAHPSYFDAMVERGSHLTRALRYPPMAEAPGGTGGNHVWAEAHGDINLITALPRATARGLQVLLDYDRDDPGALADPYSVGGTWVDAAPPEGYVIVNTGIMLEHVTNGLISTGIHRVVADPDQSGDRLSVVQFCHPKPGAILMPAPSTVTAERPARFSAIPAIERLREVIWEINLVEEGRRIDELAND